MRITEFWPWLTRHRMRFLDADGGADGGSDGGDVVGGEGFEGEHWLDTREDYAEYANDADARKHFERYKTEADQLKGHWELQKQFRQSIRVPQTLDGLDADEVAKITDRLKGVLKPEHLRELKGVPETPEGYQFEIPEGVSVHEETLNEFRQLAHAKGFSQETVQELLNLELSHFDRSNKARDKQIMGMTSNNYKRFLNEDCGGDKELAKSRVQLVTNHLQSCSLDANGEPDSTEWEKFAARTMKGDRFIELIMLRALHEAALFKLGTGGALPGSGPTPGAGGEKINVQKRWPKSVNVMQ